MARSKRQQGNEDRSVITKQSFLRMKTTSAEAWARSKRRRAQSLPRVKTSLAEAWLRSKRQRAQSLLRMTSSATAWLRSKLRRRGKISRSISINTTTPSTPAITPIRRTQASEIVLKLPEMLEQILLKLPMKDLLLAQRVSRHWEAIINGSIQLQRALFMAPVKCGSVTYLDWHLDDSGWYGLENLGPPLRGITGREKPRLYSPHWGKTRDDTNKYTVFKNPLLTKIFPVLREEDIYWCETMDHFPEEVARPEASWRRMSFTQPPIRGLALEYDLFHPGAGRGYGVMFQRRSWSTDGIGMGELLGGLMFHGRPAWIQGREQWKEYRDFEDLGEVEAGDAT